MLERKNIMDARIIAVASHPCGFGCLGIKAFEGCKKAYQDVKEFFTPREISYLRRKMEREGY